MPEYIPCNIISNKEIAKDIYDMEIKTPFENARAGQFAQLFVPKGEHILPRPISLCEIKENGVLRLVYQVVGKGTEYFSTLLSGDKINVLAPLGNGFEIVKKKNVAIVGGGVGIPPLLQLAKDIKKEMPSADISVFLGYRSEPYLVKDFAPLGVRLHIATDDGSVGFKGNVIGLMESIAFDCDIVYSCGPAPMLKALSNWAENKKIACYVSMEERMACGLGACIGCAIPIKDGDSFIYKRVCYDGPVFSASEVIWDE